MRVELAGSVQSDGSILVVKLAVVPAVPPPTTTPPPRPPTPPTPPTNTVLAGVITELAGTCPLLRINVGGRTVSTSSSTIFDGRACGELKVGATVEIAVAQASTNALLVALKVASRP